MSLVVTPSYALIKPFRADVTSSTKLPPSSSNNSVQNEENRIIFKWSSFADGTNKSNHVINGSNDVIYSLKSEKSSPVIISGWLQKMKRQSNVFAADWNRRFVIIQNNALSWKHTEESEITGSINLNDIQEFKMINYEKTQKTREKSRSFVLKTRNRALCLMASNQSDCEKWVRVIQMQLDLNSGGTSSGPSGKKNRRKSVGGRNIDKFEVCNTGALTFLTELNLF